VDVHVPKPRDQELVFSIYDGSVAWNCKRGDRANINDAISADDYGLIYTWCVVTAINDCDVLYCRDVLSTTGHGKQTHKKSGSAEIHALTCLEDYRRPVNGGIGFVS
jgi:hypothetical protein